MPSAIDHLARRQRGLLTRPQVLAACLAVGGVASHRTAAALWQLSGCRPGPVHVTVANGWTSRCAVATIHRSRTLRPSDVTRVDGIPVTRVARTLADLASHVPRPALEDAVDDALCRRLVSLYRLARQRGSPRLHAVLATWRDGTAPHGVAEARLLRRIVHAGLPPPSMSVCSWNRVSARTSTRAIQEQNRGGAGTLPAIPFCSWIAPPCPDTRNKRYCVADLLRPHFTGEEAAQPA